MCNAAAGEACEDALRCSATRWGRRAAEGAGRRRLAPYVEGTIFDVWRRDSDLVVLLALAALSMRADWHRCRACQAAAGVECSDPAKLAAVLRGAALRKERRAPCVTHQALWLLRLAACYTAAASFGAGEKGWMTSDGPIRAADSVLATCGQYVTDAQGPESAGALLIRSALTYADDMHDCDVFSLAHLALDEARGSIRP